MTKFSVSDIAMTGFGVVRQRPTLLLWWTLLHLAFMGALSLLLVTVAGPAMTQMTALQAQNTPTDPEVQAQMFALFRQLVPFYLLMAPVMLVFYAVLYAAMNRAVLRPADSSMGYIRLGLDEWRQVLLFLWAVVLALGVYIAIVVVTAILGVVAALIFMAVHKGPVAAGDGAGAGTLAVLALILLYMFAYIYVLVRFSLASAMTFDTGRVSLLKSWRLTKGRFWPMFGVYLIASLLAIVVCLLGFVVIVVCVMLMSGGNGFALIFRPDMSSLAAYLSPARLVYFGLAGVLYALVWPVLLMPPAAIYKTLSAEPTPASWPSSPSRPDPAAAVPDAPAPL